MTSIEASPKEQVRRLRAGLAHPVVDADGHLIEPVHLLFGWLAKIGGDDLAGAFGRALAEDPPFTMGNPARGEPRGGWWGSPGNALDLATVSAPGLLAERIEELGIDYSVLYPSLGLAVVSWPDDALRRATCRALNAMLAELCAPHAFRMTPAAVIPMHTPEEAIAELEFAVRELGLKTAMIPPLVGRPLAEFADAFPAAAAIDSYGIDSAHDYDPVWQAFTDLGVAVTCHGGVSMRYMPCGSFSPSNYMYNHIGGHAYQQCSFARSVIMAGVPRRFPDLRFGLLECGVGWAPDLLHGLVEHWEKRGGARFELFDPGNVDREQLNALVERHGVPPLKLGASIAGTGGERAPWVRDEFEGWGIEQEHQLATVFAEQFFFGCEADDPSVYRALHARGNPFGIRLRPLFSSDLGHWDVPDMERVVLESRGLVDAGLLTEQDYRDFVFTNPVLLHASMNPAFFDGTAIEADAKKLLSSP